MCSTPNSGEPVRGTRLLGRELAVKVVGINLANTGLAVGLAALGVGQLVILIVSLVNLLWLADAASVYFDRDRRALHDRLLDTVVVHSPEGLPQFSYLAEVLPRWNVRAQPLVSIGSPEPRHERVGRLSAAYAEGHLTTPEFDRLAQAARADDQRNMGLASWSRRFFTDYVLEQVMFIVTLGFGWFAWFMMTAKDGQTPAKSLMGTYVIDRETLRPPGAGYMWLREVALKQFSVWLFSLTLGLVLMPLVGQAVGILIIFLNGALAGSAALSLFSKERAALHDRIASTLVVHAPHGVTRPRQVANHGGRRPSVNSSLRLGATKTTGRGLCP